MLCCKRKKQDYNVAAEEEIDEKRNNETKGVESEEKKEEPVVEPAVEVTVTKETECTSPVSEKEQNGTVQSANQSSESRESTLVNGKGDNKSKYVSQMSVSSSLSIREEINRSREQFFSNQSLNDFNLQEDLSKRYSATEEKFAEHQKRVRALRASRLIEENVMSAEQMQQAVSRLEAVAARLESLAVTGVKSSSSSGGSTSEPEAVAPFVLAYDAMLESEFAKYLNLSSQIGGDVQTQAGMVKEAFQVLRNILVTASKSKKPEQAALQELLQPLSQQISAIQEFKDNNRTSPQFNHLSGIAESIPALGWVAVVPTPGPYVKDMQDAGMFYTNRVLKEYKEKDQNHADWTKAWNGTWREMMAYIKDNHTTGISWNPQGGDASAVAKSAAPPAPAAGGAPPPPPPGPPPPPPPAAPPAEDSGDDNRAALFAEINRGTAISSGLKKVTDDMKTHKNPALRASSTVSATGVRTGPAPFKANPPPKTAPKPGAKPAPAAKPPVFELQDKKWIVEYQQGNKTMVIDDTNLKQAVYMYKCTDSTLQVKGKLNSITLDSCKKVAVAFESVVSAVEFVNCQSVQAQVMGKCPTVSIDKTDGCMMYLSQESTDAEIVTAKSSEMNILVPKEDGEFVEFPLPEQFKSKWNGKKFVTDCTESV
ncbi:F-actin-capping protein subunit alpha [Mactra antiquata]